MITVLHTSLHSNLVIFQRGKIPKGMILIFTLHSNLVIFQQMVDYGAGGVAFNFTFQSGYIPTADAVSSTNSSASLHSNLVIFQF